MSTNYNRYLDLHLCTSSNIATVRGDQSRSVANGGQTQEDMDRKFFTHRGVEYFYEFRGDMEDQTRYRTGKSEGFTFDPDAIFAKGNSRNFEDVEITTADISMLRLRNGAISDALKQLRYIGCMVSIEQLKQRTVYDNLLGLVRWIGDETMTGKLRINCHGSGTVTGGYSMGHRTELTVEELVGALVRHGLTHGEKVTQTGFGLAHGARWKADAEVDRCEKCGHQFAKTWYGSTTKHHCRKCGGIFCDQCTSKRIDLRVALTGPNNLTAKNVRNARVCDKCHGEAFDFENKFGADMAVEEVFGRQAVGNELKYGLTTIALGLCQGARADDRFSPELSGGAAGMLEAGSLAARLRDELTRQHLRGIKITASNDNVANIAQTGLENQFGVNYPHTVMRRNRERDTVGRGRLLAQGEFDFPAYIWGSQESLRRTYDQLPQPKPDPQIVVQPGSRAVYFGGFSLTAAPRPAARPRVAAVASQAAAQPPAAAPPPHPPADTAMTILYSQFFQQWSFTSWHVEPMHR